ncbi:MAG: GNAT family N-acetyltransferase [Cyanobacteria bacterium J06636_27]
MSTNKNELPQDYVVRLARNSDMFQIYFLIIEKAFIKIYHLIIALCFPQIIMFVLTVWNIDTLVVSLALSLLSFSITSFIFYIINYLFWNHIVKNEECLVICYKSKICGFLIALKHQEYSHIKSLFISRCHRKKGLATYLMQQSLKNLKHPIYLLSLPKMHLFDFYTSLGFVFMKENQLPKNLKKHTRSPIRLFPMVLE